MLRKASRHERVTWLTPEPTQFILHLSFVASFKRGTAQFSIIPRLNDNYLNPIALVAPKFDTALKDKSFRDGSGRALVTWEHRTSVLIYEERHLVIASH